MRWPALAAIFQSLMTVASLKSCQVPGCWAALCPELSEKKWSGSFVWNVKLTLTISVGYTSDDVSYRWTTGRGVNIARWQQSLLSSDTNNNQHCSDMKLSQFDLISTPTGNETTLRSKGKTITDILRLSIRKYFQALFPHLLSAFISSGTWVTL